jgi:hypothetical protein
LPEMVSPRVYKEKMMNMNEPRDDLESMLTHLCFTPSPPHTSRTARGNARDARRRGPSRDARHGRRNARFPDGHARHSRYGWRRGGRLWV